MGIGYNTSVVRDGLVLYLDAANSKSYPGSETTVFDLSKNSNSTLVNGATVTNNLFVLDGINDFINTNTDSFNLSNSITFEFVLRVGSVTANKVLFGKYDGLTPDMWIGISTSNQRLFAGFYGFSSTFPVTDNIIRHYTITYNSSNGSSVMYINGLVDISTSVGARSNPRGNLMIGKFGTGSTFYFPGELGFVKIYNRPLTAQEVKLNFEATRGRYGI
jgi:hypothetical protein